MGGTQTEFVPPPIFTISTGTNYTSSDYNGFRPNNGAPVSFGWNSPPFGTAADIAGPGHAPVLVSRQYRTLDEYRGETGQDVNSILVDYDVFVNVKRLDAQDTATVQNIYRADDFDFRLREGAPAVDAGTSLPNVTDGFTGRGPDLGALETGQPVPHYGPRTGQDR
jgi:hypothetical protein